MFPSMGMRQDTCERHSGKLPSLIAGLGGLNFLALLPCRTNESIPSNCRRRVQLSTVLLGDHFEGLRCVLHKYLITPSSREYWTRLGRDVLWTKGHITQARTGSSPRRSVRRPSVAIVVIRPLAKGQVAYSSAVSSTWMIWSYNLDDNHAGSYHIAWQSRQCCLAWSVRDGISGLPWRVRRRGASSALFHQTVFFPCRFRTQQG